MVLAHQLGNVRDGAAHRHALHAQVFLGQVIVHDAHRAAKALVFALAQVDRPRARIAGAHDEQRGVIALPLPGGGFPQRLQQPPEKPHPGDGRRVEQRTDDEHRAADGAAAVNEVEQHDEAGGQSRQAQQPGKVPHTGVLPHDLVQAAEPEHDEVDGQHVPQHGQHGGDGGGALVGVAAVKPQHDGQPVAQHDQTAVQRHQRQLAGKALQQLVGFKFHDTHPAQETRSIRYFSISHISS